MEGLHVYGIIFMVSNFRRVEHKCTPGILIIFLLKLCKIFLSLSVGLSQTILVKCTYLSSTIAVLALQEKSLVGEKCLLLFSDFKMWLLSHNLYEISGNTELSSSWCLPAINVQRKLNVPMTGSTHKTTGNKRTMERATVFVCTVPKCWKEGLLALLPGASRCVQGTCPATFAPHTHQRISWERVCFLRYVVGVDWCVS